MNNPEEIFDRYKNEAGDEFYCPVKAVADDRVVSDWELENCVEVSTADRYSGSIKKIERHTSPF